LDAKAEGSTLAKGAFRNGRVLRPEDVRAAVANSDSIYEACRLLAAHNGSVYKAMQRFGIPKPSMWNEGHQFKIGRLRKLRLSTIIESSTGKAYVGIILGTEGALRPHLSPQWQIRDWSVTPPLIQARPPTA